MNNISGNVEAVLFGLGTGDVYRGGHRAAPVVLLP